MLVKLLLAEKMLFGKQEAKAKGFWHRRRGQTICLNHVFVENMFISVLIPQQNFMQGTSTIPNPIHNYC